MKSAPRAWAGAELSIHPYPHWRIQVFKIRRSSRPWDEKKNFSNLRASVWYKNKGTRGPWPPCSSPGSATAPNPLMNYFDISCNPKKNATFPPYNALGAYLPQPPPPTHTHTHLQKRMFPVCPITLRIFFSPANLIFSPTTFTYIFVLRFLFNCSFSI